MELFEKLKEVVPMGFGVKFESEGLHLNIHVTFREEIKTQVLPIQDHFSEDRLVDCIDFLVDKFYQENYK